MIMRSCLFCRSQAICQFLYRFPIFIDAAAAAAERRGDRFLARWADIMTGRMPKTHILRPDISLPIGLEVLVLLCKKVFKGGYGKKIQ